MAANRALHVKMGERAVKFKRSERVNSNPLIAKIVARKSGVPKAKKSPATKIRLPLNVMQREMKKARDRRVRGVKPTRRKAMLEVLGAHGCVRSDQFIMTGTVVSYIPPSVHATYIAKGKLEGVARQVGRKGQLWGFIQPIREKGFICLDLCDVYSPLPGRGHHHL